MKFIATISSFLAATALTLPSSTAVHCAPVPSPADSVLHLLKATSLSGESVVKAHNDMEEFARRTHDEEERNSTYKCLEEMLCAKQSLTSLDERSRLATQIIAQAADPFSVNQGRHNTCAIAALEVRSYVRHPSLVAQVIAQVAVKGEYATKAGDHIVIDAGSIDPDREARLGGYATRSYASQIFQVTAANINWQLQTKDPRNIKCKKGQLRYLQSTTAQGLIADSGERLVINRGNGISETVCDGSGRIMDQPCFSLDEVRFVSNIIDDNDSCTLLAGANFENASDCLRVNNEHQLVAQLARCKNSNSFPIVVAVDSSKGSFARGLILKVTNDKTSKTVGNLLGSQQGSCHAVLITDFDETENKVGVDNFWGAGADHIGSERLPVSEVFSALLGVRK